MCVCVCVRVYGQVQEFILVAGLLQIGGFLVIQVSWSRGSADRQPWAGPGRHLQQYTARMRGQS